MSTKEVLRRWVLCMATCVFCFFVGQQCQVSAEIIATSNPFVSPKGSYVTKKGQYHTFRIPGMVVAPDGSLLLFAEGRRGDGSDPHDDDNAPADLLMRRSTDNGQTWQNTVIIDSGFKESGAKVDFSDPTPVLDETTGTIHLFYGQWPDFSASPVNVGQDPDSSNNNQVVWVRSSSDNGLTWSNPTQILYPDQPGNSPDGLYWFYGEPGPGNGIQLRWQDGNPSRNGRLVVPAKRRGSATLGGSSSIDPFVFYSDDHGTTWQVGNPTPGPDANEDEVVELTNGHLLLNARQNDGSFRRRHLSTDGGVHWGANIGDEQPSQEVDVSMARYSAVRDGDDRDRILYSSPRGEGGLNRNNITVWTSYDEGESFINPVQISSGFAAYSVVSRLANGTIGLSYEPATSSGESYGGVRFYNFDLAHLEGAEHPATMSHYDGFGNAIDSFRGGVGWSGGWNNFGATAEAGALEFAGYSTEGDIQHAHLRGGGMTRDLGSGAIDLNANQDRYFSLFINHDDRDTTDSGAEYLTIQLLDGSGVSQAAFGVGSNEDFFIRDPGETVSSGDDVLQKDSTYLVLAKLAAQSNSSGDSFDQLFLAWYDDPSQVPTDEVSVNWQLVGNTSENSASTIERISIEGGAYADWLIDGLRIGTTFDSVIVDTGVVPSPVLGDLNGDFRITIADWIVFRGNMLLNTNALSAEDQLAEGDFDNSGLIGPEDFIAFRDLYEAANGIGALTEAVNQVPEPSSWLLLLSGWLIRVCWCSRWRRRSWTSRP